MARRHLLHTNIMRSALVGIIVFASLMMSVMRSPASVSAAPGWDRWIDPYCTGGAYNGAEPGFHWYEWAPTSYGYGRAYLYYGGGLVDVDPNQDQTELHGSGSDVTLNFYLLSYTGSGRYTGSLNYDGSFMEGDAYQEFWDC